MPPAEVPPVRSAAPRPVPPSPVPLDGAPAGGPRQDGPPQDGPPQDGPPRPRWGLGAYLLVEAVLLAASALIGLYSLRDGAFTAEEIVAGLAVPTVLAAGTALLITRIRGNGPRIDLGLEWSWNDVLLGLGFGLGGIVLTLPAASLYLAVAGEDSSSAVGEVFGGVTASAPVAVLALLVIAIVAPVCEEIVYRGLLWSGVERLGGRWAAFVVTTLLFALAHFEFSRTPLLLVLALPIAAARLYTGRLLASIVAHQVNNLLPGVALMLALLGVVPPA